MSLRGAFNRSDCPIRQSQHPANPTMHPALLSRCSLSDVFPSVLSGHWNRQKDQRLWARSYKKVRSSYVSRWPFFPSSLSAFYSSSHHSCESYPAIETYRNNNGNETLFPFHRPPRRPRSRIPRSQKPKPLPRSREQSRLSTLPLFPKGLCDIRRRRRSRTSMVRLCRFWPAFRRSLWRGLCFTEHETDHGCCGKGAE